ncbi:isopentenyl-diphosphate Delta-isomerase [Thalassobacter stenotrophicus]|mgnify:FL=1|uniref:isopentenyl-diphosphate Delta-isomerase n=1 Tax=Thalassobacter TaxID=266808 RepID=UPI00051D2446|nr:MULTISPECIES: isopentenyl-diphosphate Delta-isomerase [Thalassobacter]KGK78607.1 isopentenyl-diphosphate delta-isomerase [Thalassobacter stenotrophicus]KGL00661.1 isopentenyl-diphosphate delta-isomerase [Thalassobacter sp. 16PALIMAR09]UYP67754.1 isopentenyl-diphosphate Delta-isomerase [Thalassobacter stenotrophicus]
MTIMIPAWVDGTLTPVEKLEAHVKGLRHKAISVFVMDGDHLLIQKRAAGKYHTPGLWANTCCTHPEWNESGMDCAQRRLKEELGITGLTLDQRETLEYRAPVGGGMIEHEVVEVFVANAPDVTWDLNPDEVEAVRWVHTDALTDDIARNPDQFTAWLRIYMTEHKERIFGDLIRA